MSILSKPQPGSELQPAASADNGKRRGPAAALAAPPRANLLPPEIGETARRRATRRGLRVVVVVAALIAVAGVAGAWQLSVAAHNGLAAEQQKTVALTAEKAKYADVAKTTSGIRLGKAAVKVGGSTDIDWSAYLAKLQATLPAGVTLTAVDVTSASATTEFPQSTVPLAGSRVATITFTATSSTLPSIPDWIDGLSSLPGFAGATPNSVSSDDNGFTASVSMDVGSAAFSHRFAPAEKGATK